MAEITAFFMLLLGVAGFVWWQYYGQPNPPQNMLDLYVALYHMYVRCGLRLLTRLRCSIVSIPIYVYERVPIKGVVHGRVRTSLPIPIRGIVYTGYLALLSVLLVNP